MVKMTGLQRDQEHKGLWKAKSGTEQCRKISHSFHMQTKHKYTHYLLNRNICGTLWRQSFVANKLCLMRHVIGKVVVR